MIPHSTPAGKLKFTEVYLVSLRLHVCEPGSQESLSGFTQFPRWPWGYAGHSPSFSPTPCLACVGGGQVGENWPTPALVSSLVNCLPQVCVSSLPLRNPPTDGGPLWILQNCQPITSPHQLQQSGLGNKVGDAQLHLSRALKAATSVTPACP